MKAATKQHKNRSRDDGISIHAAREGGDPIYRFSLAALDISIHAAREGGDVGTVAKPFEWFADFNPRRP